jgi:FtsX-like permease family
VRPLTLARLALAGSRTDTLRVVFTGVAAALGALTLLAAATVVAVPELPGAYHDNNYSTAVIAQPGLRPGVVATLLLIAVPILALAGQCVRFGSPGRDRRLAAIRLAGATPRQAVLIAAGETTIAALLGSLSGLGVYALLHWALNRPRPDGMLPLPTDVLPSIPAFVVILLIVPVLAGLAAAFLLRKVIITPFGVVRLVREHRPSVVPGILIIAGVFSPFVIKPFGRWLYDLGAKLGITIGMIAGVLFVLAAIIGVIVGTGWITYTTGRILHRFARRPGALLAGRQLMADPWSGSRMFAALLTTVIIGAGVYGYRSLLTTQFEASAKASELAGNGDGSGYDTGFYLGTIGLINLTVEIGAVVAAIGILVALAEGIVSRRRTYAALVATGVPRRTLGAAIAWQTLTPLVPAVLVALIIGFSLVRTPASSVTEGDQSCVGDAVSCVPTADVTLRVPVPVGDLALLGGGTLVVMMLVVGVGLLFLRMSTDVAELRAG